MKKTFCIYCSDGASRVLKFYSQPNNLIKYPPSKVIYDGDKEEVINKLKILFGKDFIIFNNKNEFYNPKKKHTSTSKFIHKILQEFGIQYLFCFGNKILKKDLIEAYPYKLINFHPSILPSFKGLLAINQAINAKVSFLGNTAHFIDEGVDTGKIIIQTSMLSEDFEDFEDVLELQLPMMKMVLRDILNYDICNDDIFDDISNRHKRFFMPKQCNIN